MERNATCKQTKYFDANEDPIFEGDILEFSKMTSVTFNSKYGVVEKAVNSEGWKLRCDSGEVIDFGILSKMGELKIVGNATAGDNLNRMDK